MTDKVITFSKSLNGYSPQEVDNYVEMLQNAYEELRNDIAKKDKKILDLIDENKKLSDEQNIAKYDLNKLSEKIKEKDNSIKQLNFELEKEKHLKNELNDKYKQTGAEFSDIFNAAKTAADDYVYKAKAKMQYELEQTKKIIAEKRAQAEHKAIFIVENAKEESKKIILAAEDKRRLILRDAQIKLKAAEQKAHSLEISSQKTMNEILNRFKAEYTDINSMLDASVKGYMDVLVENTLNKEQRLIDDSVNIKKDIKNDDDILFKSFDIDDLDIDSTKPASFSSRDLDEITYEGELERMKENV